MWVHGLRNIFEFMLSSQVAPALAAGFTMVVKPAELTTFTAVAADQLALEARFPAVSFPDAIGPPHLQFCVITPTAYRTNQLTERAFDV